MKESTVLSTENVAEVQDECSKEKCINCFVHSGCMYDHAAVINFFRLNTELLKQHRQTGRIITKQ
jgi:hypothetical protein